MQREAEKFELLIVEGAARGGGITKLPGVGAIMQDVCRLVVRDIGEGRCLRFHPPQLASGRTLPRPKWAICTSAKRNYATSALGAAGIDIPDVFVVSEDVKQGKPA